jgi:protein-S-isoprenylcysteine O-methyltransferase Ste14
MAAAKVERFRLRFAAWYSLANADATYDAITRVPALAYFGLAIWLQALAAANVLLVDQGLTDDLRIVTVVARTATLTVFLSFALLTIVRRKPVARSKGLWPRLVAVGAVGCLFANAFMAHPQPSYAWELSSAILIAISGALTCFVVVRLGRSFSTMPEARQLVTGGPYRFVRHPLYVAEELAIIGVYLQNRSLIALCLLVVQFWLQLQRMQCEEEVLADAFPAYGDYCRRTARLVPGIY